MSSFLAGFEQPGHLASDSARALIDACQVWGGAASHIHQTILVLVDATLDGLSSPFMSGRHCWATSG